MGKFKGREFEIPAEYAEGPWTVSESSPTTIVAMRCGVNIRIGDTFASGFGSSVEVANARLMAAAPKLVQALEQSIISFCENCPSAADGGKICREKKSICQIREQRELLAYCRGGEGK